MPGYKNIILVCIFLLTLTGCGGTKFRPESSALELDPVRRGWSFVESSEEIADIPTGAQPIDFTSATISGNRLVYGAERFGILVLNKNSGEVLWRKKLPAGVSTDVFVEGDVIYSGSRKGILYAHNVVSGEELWQQDLRFPLVGKPALLQGRLLVGSIDHAMHAIDAITGKILWTYRRNPGGTTSIKGGGNAKVIDGKFWVGFADGTLVVLEPNDGSVLTERQFRDNLKFMDIDAPPVPHRQGVFVSTYDGKLRYLKRDGLPIWTFPQGSANPVLPVGNVGKIFLPGSDGIVYALAESSGKRIWQFPLEKGIPTGLSYFEAPTKAEPKRGILVAASTDNFVYVLHAGSGKLLQKFSLGSSSGSYGQITTDEETNSFFLVSHYGRLFQFRVRNGVL